jgi:hypothetical protein
VHSVAEGLPPQTLAAKDFFVDVGLDLFDAKAGVTIGIEAEMPTREFVGGKIKKCPAHVDDVEFDVPASCTGLQRLSAAISRDRVHLFLGIFRPFGQRLALVIFLFGLLT